MSVCVWMEKQEGKNDNNIHRYSRHVREEKWKRNREFFSLHTPIQIWGGKISHRYFLVVSVIA